MLSLFSSDGKLQNLPLAHGVATNDTPIWSADSQALYYHTVIEQCLAIPGIATQHVKGSTAFHSDVTAFPEIGYDEIHHVDVFGHDSVLWRHESDGSSLPTIPIKRIYVVYQYKVP